MSLQESAPRVIPDAPWARLHPLSPLVRFGRQFAALVVVLLSTTLTQGHSDIVTRLTDLALLALGLLAGIVSWAVTRWRIIGSELAINTGLIRRSSTRLPLRRIQAVDVVRPLLARFCGLAEVRVIVAGTGGGQGRLAYLREEDAEALRSRLLALAHGLHEETPTPDERPVVAVDNRRLVVSVLLGTASVVLMVLLLALLVVAVVAGGDAAAGIASSLATVLLALALALGRRVNAEFGQTVAEAPDGLRVRGGLLQTRSETVPFTRLQAVRWIEPWLWRPFGWCRIEVDVARQRNKRSGSGDDPDNGAVSRALLPVGLRYEGQRLVDGFLPGIPAGAAWQAGRAPTRASWKAPLAYRHLGVWDNDQVIVVGSGRLARVATIVPLHKVQSIRMVQGPLSRRLRLANVHIDLVGRRWRAIARCRDADEARTLVESLSVRSRAARALADATRL